MPPRVASFTVDLEPDCPPYLWTWRGVEEGMPRLLELLARRSIRATFFTTGEVARRFPRLIERLVAEGHELACHGMSHQPFDRMSRAEAEHEISESAAILRGFAPVTSFRAPYLRFPSEYLELLVAHGFTLDSSSARYKRGGHDGPAALKRIPASVTSSVHRAWDVVRWPYLRLLREPVVLFVHPWEFVDLTRERLRWDCRLRTGDPALVRTGEVLDDFVRRGTRFLTMRQLARVA